MSVKTDDACTDHKERWQNKMLTIKIRLPLSTDVPIYGKDMCLENSGLKVQKVELRKTCATDHFQASTTKISAHSSRHITHRSSLITIHSTLSSELIRQIHVCITMEVSNLVEVGEVCPRVGVLFNDRITTPALILGSTHDSLNFSNNCKHPFLSATQITTTHNKDHVA